MKKELISNLIWRFMERVGAKLITFIVQIVLARLLLPEDYGVVALITVFITLLEVFIDSGLGNALIQKPDADDTDFSTVFFFNIAMCALLYLLLFFCAPLISDFYGNPAMTPVIRVAGLTLLVSGVKNIQQAYVGKHMLFKKFFFSTLGGTIFSGILGIAMAYAGCGVWALVAQQLSNPLIDTLILWITVGWRPRWRFSWKEFRRLFSFGWRLLVSSLLENVYAQLSSLIIGKKYTSEKLAYYNQGQKIPSLLIYNLNTAIISVLFPALAREQTDRLQVKAHVKRTIQISSYVIWPLMIGIAACAEPLVTLMLTEKWLPAVPFLRVACFTFGFFTFHTANLQAMSALGKSDSYLKVEIIKMTYSTVILLLAVPYGVLAIALSELLSDLIDTFVDAWPNRKLIDYPYLEQMGDVLPSLLLSCGMGFLVLQITRLGLSPFVTLCIQVPAGALIYLAGSCIFRLRSFRYLLDTLAAARKRKEEA